MGNKKKYKNSNRAKKKKIFEKVYTAKEKVKRVWCEMNGSKNKSVFKRGTKYSYIIDTENKTVRIVPYSDKYKTLGKGTVSHKQEGKVEVIDICNKKIQSLFEGCKQYKITVFKNEIFVEKYEETESTSILEKINNVLSFSAKKEKKREVVVIPKNRYEVLLKASGCEGQIGFFDNFESEYTFTTDITSKTYSNKIINSREVKKDRPILKNTLKLLSLFSGIGAFEEALKNNGQPYNLVNYCEFQPFISKSYSLIHNESESKNLGDITKVDETKLDDFDIMTFGFPCQDISSLGDQKGFVNDNGEKTRSGLFFDAIRIMKHKLPKIAIIENVRALVSKKMSNNFEKMKELITSLGYNFYHSILNTKDYGIPHSRSRFFGVCIRRDIDTNSFEFPEPQPLEKLASDYYDKIESISEEYYLEERQYKYFNEMRLKKKYSSLNSDVLVCMTTKQGGRSNPQNFVKDRRGYRTLTANEMFALQGFKKSYARKLLRNGLTISQIGYMCGNTISVCVVEHIFKKLAEALPDIFYNKKVISLY